jgi:hypothetical protein
VNLNIPAGTTVAPGGTMTVNGTIDTNGAPATSIMFSLSGLNDGVEATLASPRGVVQVVSGNQPVTVAIHFYPGTRLGPALGTIQWAPAGQATAASPDWLAVDSLDVVVAYPPTPLPAEWWFWAAIAAALGAAAGVIFRVRQDRREKTRWHRGGAKNTPKPRRRFQLADGTALRRESGRYQEASRSPTVPGGAGPTSSTRRRTRSGWRRLPWK